MAGIAHNIGILINEVGVVGLDAGRCIGVAGAVPLRIGRILLERGCNIIHVKQIALAVDDVHRVLCKASGQGIAIGVCPGAEPASAALFIDGCLNLGKDLFKVALFLGQVDAQCAGIAGQPR